MYSIAWKPFYDLLTQTIANAGVKPNYVIYDGNTINILSLVNVGLGVAIIPQSALTFKLENITYLPLEQETGLRNNLYYIWRNDNNNEAFKLILNGPGQQNFVPIKLNSAQNINHQVVR